MILLSLKILLFQQSYKNQTSSSEISDSLELSKPINAPASASSVFRVNCFVIRSILYM